MKKSIFIFVSLFGVTLIFPPPANAQITYREKIFIVATGPGVSDEAVANDCDESLAFVASRWGVGGITLTNFVRSKLYSVGTWSDTGKVLNPSLQEVGELLACQDWSAFSAENNFVPAYYEVTIGGRKYLTEGGALAINSPDMQRFTGGGQVGSGRFPRDNVIIFNFRGSIIPSDQGRAGGSITINSIFDTQSDEYNSASILVLRFFKPIREEAE